MTREDNWRCANREQTRHPGLYRGNADQLLVLPVKGQIVLEAVRNHLGAWIPATETVNWTGTHPAAVVPAETAAQLTGGAKAAAAILAEAGTGTATG